MASTLKHLRSSTADKRPTGSGLSDGQIAINTASGTPGLFVKDNAGDIVKIGPAHVGTVAPNAVPAGSTGNSKGEMWVDENLTTRGLKYYDGTNFVNLTPSGTSTTIGLVQLATNAETQAGTVSTKAVTPSGLQSKVSDSISTTSSTVLASATAVKTAYDLANAALPKSGGTVSGVLEIGSTGTFQFDGSSADANKTVLAVVNPTANRTITLPNVTGTVVTTGDNGTVTSTMIADGTIANVDINASAAIVDTKLATISTAGKVSNSATTATNANTASAIVARDGSGNFSAGTISATFIGNLTGTASAIADNTVTSAKIVDGTIVNADVNASAAIADTKLATISTAGKVSNSATTATSSSTGNAIVTRDASGNFTAGTITANLSGTATNCSRQILSGNGMAFTGGALNTDRTITLGTPGTLTGSTTNSVSASSHTHAITVNLGVTAGTTSGPRITSSAGAEAIIPTATGSASGIVTTGTQTFAGNKTFDGTCRFATGTSLFELGAPVSGFPANDTTGAGALVYNGDTRRLSMMASDNAVLNCARRSTTGRVAQWYYDGSIVGHITVTTTNTAYNTSSDYRLKENVVPLTGAIDRIQQLPVHRFNFIADPDTVVDGFIAHEAQEVVPECVTGTKDEVDDDGSPVYQGIDQSKLVPLLTAALQEAIAEIASLKDRVAALEAS